MVAYRAMSEFTFQWPTALALLLISFPLAGLLLHARKQRLLLLQAMDGNHPTHRKRRDILRIAAFILLILSLARPGYAPHTEATSRSGRDVVFAIDVSQSMLAEDAKPSRLEVAKQGIRDALNIFHSERVGLVVYAGSASIQCPLTYDYDFVRYMLNNVHTRTVDFGGTTLQSAVEKAVDQVFIDGRQGVQDLIVLTDGGDHGSIIPKTIDLLDKKGVDTLLIGLGNPHQEAPIKLKDLEGNTRLLEYQGSPVYTKLDDAALREFAAQSKRIDYFAPGISPFNLGQVYSDYAHNKQSNFTDTENGILVYKEAAVFFLIPALILLLLSERVGVRGIQLTHAGLILGATFMLAPRSNGGEALQENFNQAITSLQAETFEEAQALFAELHQQATQHTATTDQLAAIEFNRGLALIGQANAQESPQLALSYAQQAQLAFLSAKRSAPDLERAGIRLQITARIVTELRKQIANTEAQNNQLSQEIENIIKRLEALLEAQSNLRKTLVVHASGTSATTQIKAFIKHQNELHTEAAEVQLAMQKVDAMKQLPDKGTASHNTPMRAAIQLIQLAQISQKSAATHLQQFEQWPISIQLQLDAEYQIEKILKLLANDSQNDPSENQDWDEFEEDFDYTEESQQSTNRSEALKGDFAASSEMQELPVPNYSAEDILMEEVGNQQFRQQKRASANAAKVEKDF